MLDECKSTSMIRLARNVGYMKELHLFISEFSLLKKDLPFIKINKTNKLLFGLLCIILILFSSIVLSNNNVTNEFLYQNMALVEMSLNQSHMVQYNYSNDKGIFAFIDVAPGHSMFLIELARLSNLPIRNIQFVPIGFLILPLSYFLLGRLLLRSTISSVLLSLYICYEYSQAPVMYSVFAYAITIPLFFIFIYVHNAILERDKKTNYIILLMLIFLSVNFMHYTATAWIIIYMFIINMMSISSNLINKRSIDLHSTTLNSSLLFLIIFLAFNKTFYNLYLPPILSKAVTIDETIYIFLGRIQNYMTGSSFQDPTSYLYTTESNALLGQLSVIHIILILLPIILFTLYGFKKFFTIRKAPILDTSSRIAFILVLIGMFDIISYMLRGNVSTKSISIIFPLISAFCLYKLKINNFIRMGFVILLFLVLSSKCGLFYYTGYIAETPSYLDSEMSSNWLFENNPLHNITILSDLHTYGQYLVKGVSYNTIPRLLYYDSDIYGSLIIDSNKSENLKDKCDYIIINKKLSLLPLKSFWWKVYEPLDSHLAQIRMNKHINTIYNDNILWILKPV